MLANGRVLLSTSLVKGDAPEIDNKPLCSREQKAYHLVCAAGVFAVAQRLC